MIIEVQLPSGEFVDIELPDDATEEMVNDAIKQISGLDVEIPVAEAPADVTRVDQSLPTSSLLSDPLALAQAYKEKLAGEGTQISIEQAMQDVAGTPRAVYASLGDKNVPLAKTFDYISFPGRFGTAALGKAFGSDESMLESMARIEAPKDAGFTRSLAEGITRSPLTVLSGGTAGAGRSLASR